MSSPRVSYEELEEAFEVVSFGGGTESAGYVCKITGAIYLDYDGIDEELPDDLQENDRYVRIPTKIELNLGRSLVLRFVSSHLPDQYEQVEEIFSRKGAYSGFNALLDRRGALEAWREFEANAIREELLDWCRESGIEADA